MRIACLFGFHAWDGCKCWYCGKTRNKGHNWSKNCEKCAQCEITRKDAHTWDGCKCSVCGAIRRGKHDWSKDCEKCDRCGTTRKDKHLWDGCFCTKCNMIRDEGHNWAGVKCTKCGITKQEQRDAAAKAKRIIDKGDTPCGIFRMGMSYEEIEKILGEPDSTSWWGNISSLLSDLEKGGSIWTGMVSNSPLVGPSKNIPMFDNRQHSASWYKSNGTYRLGFLNGRLNKCDYAEKS